MTLNHPIQAGSQLLTPESVLYIYYFEGTLPKTNPFCLNNFVGNWEEEGFSFLFFLQPAMDQVKPLIESCPHLKLLDTYEMTYREWQGGDFTPVRIGQFALYPPWEEQVQDDKTIPITLDSGVVFGNGTHPTTLACLEAVEIACKGGKVKTMMDLGTGTGVLALGAAKLGCSSVLAVDFNFLACRTAHRNIQLNNLEKSVLVVNGKAEELLGRSTDLLVANIHYDIMKELVKSEYFTKQKWFVLSGLLNSEADKITTHLKQLPVHILKKWHSNGVWNTILGITAAG